jgi:hypothetical protein
LAEEKLGAPDQFLHLAKRHRYVALATLGKQLRIKAMLKRHPFLSSAWTAAIVTLAWFAIFASGGGAEAEAVSVACTNPHSGATWRIAIDYDRNTVDSNPASIDETEIWWRDANGWRYTLDRKSGALTVVLASATGGNFLFDQCRMP